MSKVLPVECNNFNGNLLQQENIRNVDFGFFVSISKINIWEEIKKKK